MEDYWYRAIIGFDQAYGHKTALCCWIAGAETNYMETLSEETIGNVCVKLLRQFLNNSSIPTPKKILKLVVLNSIFSRCCKVVSLIR